MSGRKYSQYRLQREREEKLRLLQTIASVEGEVNSLKEHIANMLGNASQGLLSTFSQEVELAQEWMMHLRLPETREFGMSTDIDVLRKAHQALQGAAAEGRKIQQLLTVAFTQKADAMGHQLAEQLAELEQLYLSGKQLLRLWFGEETVKQWEQRLEEAHGMLGEEQYGKLEPLIIQLREELADKIKLADEQEEKHQKRLYLLRALRQVCADMGFEEVVPPHYEREGDRRSRILLTVDTFDRGKIDFVLSLEGISSFSEIAEDRCFEEFDKLSQFL